jgi:hypothetical protein
MFETREPLVPVSTELKFPVTPLLELLEVGVVVLLPPPQAASAITTDNTRSKPARPQPNCLRRGLPTPSRIVSKITEANEIIPAAAQFGIFHGRPKGMSLLAVVVFTVTVTGMPVVEDVDEVKTTLAGLKLHVAAGGKFEQARVTVPVYPFTG